MQRLIHVHLFRRVCDDFTENCVGRCLTCSSVYLCAFLSAFVFRRRFHRVSLPARGRGSFSVQIVCCLRRRIRAGLALGSLTRCFGCSRSRFSALFRGRANASPVGCFAHLGVRGTYRCVRLASVGLGRVTVQLKFRRRTCFSHIFAGIVKVSPSSCQGGRTSGEWVGEGPRGRRFLQLAAWFRVGLLRVGGQGVRRATTVASRVGSGLVTILRPSFLNVSSVLFLLKDLVVRYNNVTLSIFRGVGKWKSLFLISNVRRTCVPVKPQATNSRGVFTRFSVRRTNFTPCNQGEVVGADYNVYFSREFNETYTANSPQ